MFDQGLGDVFVIRVAGNVVDDDILASIEMCRAILVKSGARSEPESALLWFQ